MDDTNEGRKRKRSLETLKGKTKRLRPSTPEIIVPCTPPEDAGGELPASAKVPAGSSVRSGNTKVSARVVPSTMIVDDESIIAETDYEDDLSMVHLSPTWREARPSHSSPANKGDKTPSARGKETSSKVPPKHTELMPFALPHRDLADKSRMLQKVGLRGNLVYKADKISAPVVARLHQIRSMLIDHRAELLDKELQDAILNADHPPKYARRPHGRLFVIKEVTNARAIYEELPLETRRKWSPREEQYLGARPDWGLSDREISDLGFSDENAGRYGRSNSKNTAVGGHDEVDFHDHIAWPVLEHHPVQRRSKYTPGAWQLGNSDLYLLEGSNNYLVSAKELSWTHFDTSPPGQPYLRQVDTGLLRMTEPGTEALNDVLMIVRESQTSYTLMRSGGIGARSYEGWTVGYWRCGVFLRDEKSDFLSIDRYNSTYQDRHKREPARARFAVLCAAARGTDEFRPEVAIPRKQQLKDEYASPTMHPPLSDTHEQVSTAIPLASADVSGVTPRGLDHKLHSRARSR